MEFTLKLILFVFLVNWISAMHVVNQSSKTGMIKFIAIFIAVASSVAIGFIFI